MQKGNNGVKPSSTACPLHYCFRAILFSFFLGYVTICVSWDAMTCSGNHFAPLMLKVHRWLCEFMMVCHLLGRTSRSVEEKGTLLDILWATQTIKGVNRRAERGRSAERNEE